MNSTPVPWKVIGTPVQRARSVEEAITLAGFDYKVTKRPLKATIRGRKQVEVPGFFSTVRQDTGKILGVVKSRYEIIDNKSALSFMSPAIRNGDATVETCGIVSGGAKAWILLRLNKDMFIGPSRDLVQRYLLLVNSFDGSTPVVAKITPIRFACSNTLAAALRGTGPEFKIRHTQQAPFLISEMQKLMADVDLQYSQLEYVFNRLALRRLTDKELLTYVKTLVPDNEEAESHARTENMRSNILELHERGIEANRNRGTLFGVYNAVTELVDHHLSSKNPERHLSSIWFGSGERMKQRAFSLAESMLSN